MKGIQQISAYQNIETGTWIGFVDLEETHMVNQYPADDTWEKEHIRYYAEKRHFSAQQALQDALEMATRYAQQQERAASNQLLEEDGF